MNNPHINIPYHTIEKYFPFIYENKLDLEIYFNSDTLDRIDLDSILRNLASFDYAPSLSIHAPFMDLSPGAVDSKIREATMSRFHQIMDIASQVNPKTIVFHSGYEKWKYELNIDIWLEKSLITWREIVERAGKIGCRIAIENIFEDSPKNLRMLAESMNSELFGLCFDSGHFNLFSQETLETWIHETGEYIIEFHLHDNDGTQDAHASMGNGTFNFSKLFELLRHRNDILHTIEAHTPAEVSESISVLKSY